MAKRRKKSKKKTAKKTRKRRVSAKQHAHLARARGMRKGGVAAHMAAANKRGNAMLHHAVKKLESVADYMKNSMKRGHR